MKISTQTSNDIQILHVEGEMNANTSQEVEETVHQLIEQGNSKFVFNLDHLNYISSSGLRVFLMINKLINLKRGRLRLCGLTDPVKEVFEISGFQMIFRIFPNEEEALKEW